MNFARRNSGPHEHYSSEQERTFLELLRSSEALRKCRISFSPRRYRLVHPPENGVPHRNPHPEMPRKRAIRVEFRSSAPIPLQSWLEHFPVDTTREGIPKVVWMSESIRIDSVLRGGTVPKAYSEDLRRRVIDAVEAGASRHEAAEDHGVSASSAIKWMQSWRDSGTSTPKPRGGSSSPLDQHSEWILSLIVTQPDLILEEIVAALRKRRIPGSRSALGRFFVRHDITVKKKSAGGGTTPSGRRSGAPQVDPRTRPA